VVDSINADDNEPISNVTYKSMLDDSQNAAMGLIIGRVKTRDRLSFRKVYYHNFYGGNLIKLLFKPLVLNNETILRHRYHNE